VAVRLLRRVNRFAVEAFCPVRGATLRLHLPNSGRMQELLVPGAGGLAALRADEGRDTAGTLLLVRHRRRWVGVDAHLPNRLLRAAVLARALEPFAGYTACRPEVPLAGERLDFLLSGPAGSCLVEVKSCNRVDGRVALFPDAPTARGTRHLGLLARVREAGGRAAVAGVEFYAYCCRVRPQAVAVARAVPVELG
jgi:sugar fermentation stimulation protein A